MCAPGDTATSWQAGARPAGGDQRRRSFVAAALMLLMRGDEFQDQIRVLAPGNRREVVAAVTEMAKLPDEGSKTSLNASIPATPASSATEQVRRPAASSHRAAAPARSSAPGGRSGATCPGQHRRPVKPGKVDTDPASCLRRMALYRYISSGQRCCSSQVLVCGKQLVDAVKKLRLCQVCCLPVAGVCQRASKSPRRDRSPAQDLTWSAGTGQARRQHQHLAVGFIRGAARPGGLMPITDSSDSGGMPRLSRCDLSCHIKIRL